MTIQEPIIHFFGTLINKESDTLVSRDDLTIEYYNITSSTWETFVPTVKVAKNKFNIKIDLNSEEFKANNALTPIYETITANSFPLMRLAVIKGVRDKTRKVISVGGIVNAKVEKERNVIDVSFSNIWLTEPFSIKRVVPGKFPDAEFIAIGQDRPAPSNPFFPALEAAISETERFTDYKADTHTVFVRPKDDVYEANDAKIKELQEELNQAQEAQNNLITQLDAEQANVRTLNETLSETNESLEAEKQRADDLDGALVISNRNLRVANVQVNDLTAELNTEKQTSENLSNELKVVNGTLVRTRAALKDLSTELDDEKLKSENFATQLKIANSNLIRSKATVETLEADAQKSAIKITGLETNLNQLQTQLAAETTMVAQLQTNLVQKEQDLTTEKNKVVTLEENVSSKNIEIERLETEKTDILGRDATSANDIFTSIVEEVQIASEKAAGGRYSVSNLSLSLKTHVKKDAEGFKLQLIDSARADYVKDGTVSDVKIDLISQEPNNTDNNGLVMPKVTGLTETAARNRLLNFGLSMKPIYQAATSREMVIGQALKQTPEAGEDITTGETVTVIFVKNPDNFN